MKLEPELRDALTELVGIGVGKAAEVLNAMLDSHIVLSAPAIRIVSPDELAALLDKADGGEFSAVLMRYDGSLRGAVELIFSTAEAGKLVDCIVGGDPVLEEGLDAIRAGTLCEVGNIVINALLGTIANTLRLRLEYTVPSFREGNAGLLIADAGIPESNVVLYAETEFRVETKSISGTIAVFFSLESFRHLREAVDAFAGKNA